MAHPFAHLTLDTLTREEVLKQFVEDLKAYAESTETFRLEILFTKTNTKTSKQTLF